MALSSMTGFARSHGVSGAYAWAWEIKSVNAKGLDCGCGCRPGWDAVEVPVRSRAAEVLARGTVYGTLTAKREGVAPVVRVNEPVLSGGARDHQESRGPRRRRAAAARRHPRARRA